MGIYMVLYLFCNIISCCAFLVLIWTAGCTGGGVTAAVKSCYFNSKERVKVYNIVRQVFFVDFSGVFVAHAGVREPRLGSRQRILISL